jgi:hypothetical protein
MTLQNETLRQGESQNITVTVYSNDTPPERINLTNATLKWEMWHPLTGAVLTKITPVDIEILDQNDFEGKCAVTITKTDTSALIPLTYWHALLYVPFVGDSDVVMEGYIIVKSSRGLGVVEE